MKDEILDFFDPQQPSPEPPSNDDILIAIINALFVCGLTAGSIYYMHHYAHAGALGSIGVGLFLMLPVAIFIIAMKNNFIRARSFVAATLLLGVFGAYFLVLNLTTSKPINDKNFQEVYSAAVGKNQQ